IKGDSLTVSDWLKLLDPYMISPISARYHNKMGSAKVIIITNTKEPLTFFEQVKGNIGEDLGQFIRRIDYLVEIKEEFHFYVPEKSKVLPTKSELSYYEPRHYSLTCSAFKKYASNVAVYK
ncbi:Rep family protein, partial [Enterococcus faecalis]